ncbi:Centromere/kinetochore protein zw10 [Nowakowskiella sp. JEL0407]|nr:Centromere/kinetochore protein zw10 [Nowakowskiella sp. JEL0407]
MTCQFKEETILNLQRDILKVSYDALIVPAVVNGHVNKNVAFQFYYNNFLPPSMTLKKSGIWIDRWNTWLAASPDGLLYDGEELVGILEIKCPVDFPPKYLMMYEGVYVLDPSDSYYYQIQVQMRVAGVKWGEFVVWHEMGQARIHELIRQWDVSSLSDLNAQTLYYNQLNHSLASLETDFVADCPEETLELLKDEVLDRQSSLRNRLTELFFSSLCLVKDANNVMIHVTFKVLPPTGRLRYPTPIPHPDILLATTELELFDTLFTRFLDSLHDQLISKIWEGQVEFIGELSPTPTQQTASKSIKPSAATRTSVKLHNGRTLQCKFKKQSTLTSRTTESNNATGNQEQTQSKIKQVIKIATFLSDYLFGYANTEDLKQKFVGLWWPKLWPELDKYLLWENVRKSSGDCENITGALDVEAGLVELLEMEMIPNSLAGEFEAEVEDRMRRYYGLKKRGEVLDVVRELLLSGDENISLIYEGSERGGISAISPYNIKSQNGKGGGKGGKGSISGGEPAVKLETCYVSQKVQTMMEMVYQLALSGQTNENSIEATFHQIRDIFNLYRGLIPTTIESASMTSYSNGFSELDPTKVGIKCNDIEYVIYHLVTLGFVVNKSFYGGVEEWKEKRKMRSVTFVDMIPVFRKLEVIYFTAVMRSIRDAMKAAILNTRGKWHISNLSDDDTYESIEQHVGRAVGILLGVGKKWKTILPSEKYLQSMGILTDALITEVFNAIRDEDVNETASLDKKRKGTKMTMKNKNDSAVEIPEILNKIGVSTNSDLNYSEGSGNEKYQVRYLLSILDKCEDVFETRATGVVTSEMTKPGGMKFERVPLFKYCENWQYFLNLMNALKS